MVCYGMLRIFFFFSIWCASLCAGLMVQLVPLGLMDEKTVRYAGVSFLSNYKTWCLSRAVMSLKRFDLDNIEVYSVSRLVKASCVS